MKNSHTNNPFTLWKVFVSVQIACTVWPPYPSAGKCYNNSGKRCSLSAGYALCWAVKGLQLDAQIWVDYWLCPLYGQMHADYWLCHLYGQMHADYWLCHLCGQMHADYWLHRLYGQMHADYWLHRLYGQMHADYWLRRLYGQMHGDYWLHRLYGQMHADYWLRRLYGQMHADYWLCPLLTGHKTPGFTYLLMPSVRLWWVCSWMARWSSQTLSLTERKSASVTASAPSPRSSRHPWCTMHSTRWVCACAYQCVCFSVYQWVFNILLFFMCS